MNNEKLEYEIRENITKIHDEVTTALRNWPSWNSAHEGYAIILEEMDELKAHVWTNQKKRNISDMKKEALQVAATALRFASEICNEEKGRK